MLPPEAAADPMAKAHGLADPRGSDTAAAMEGVEGHGSHDHDGDSAVTATAGQKVCNYRHMNKMLPAVVELCVLCAQHQHASLQVGCCMCITWWQKRGDRGQRWTLGGGGGG